MALLVFNPGSTTLKVALVSPQGEILEQYAVETDGKQLTELTRDALERFPDISGIGCRVVHGGKKYVEPTRVTSEVIDDIRALSHLAPLHNPAAAMVLEACLNEAKVPVIAVFDTAFHHTLPPMARTYGLNHDVAEREDLHRYGFHGIAHQEISQILAWVMGEEDKPRRRLITCQLGGGDSICAVLDGKSIDTTMGMTPLEGLVMATRSGDLDPGIIFELLRRGWSTEKVEKLLLEESGLLGLSGISDDPRALFTAASEGNQQASLALEVYTYRIAKYIGAYAAALGGIDGIGFSGGVGQHSGAIRAKVCAYLGYLGLTLDPERNSIAEPHKPTKLHTDTSTISVWAIPAVEELSIARAVRICC